MTITSGTKLGRYEIRSKPEGGMGEVFLAQDTKLDRKVALKVLPAEVASDPDRMRPFVQEAKAASALNHPNIITIHEIDQTDSIHFIATEYIEGETLRQRMRDAPMKLDPGLYEAQLTQAFIKFFYEWDWPAVEQQVRRLQERHPNDPNVHTLNAYYLLTMGRRDEALAESKRALDLDPLATHLTVDLATVLSSRGQYDEAINLLRETLETDPNSMLVHLVLGRAYDLKGSYQEAVANYNEVIRLIGRDPYTLSYLGRAYAISGNRAEAQRLLGELTELSKQTYVFPLCMVYIYVGLGEKEQAFKWLEKAYEEKDTNLIVPGIRFDPMLDPLRSDPRYEDLVRRINLSPN